MRIMKKLESLKQFAHDTFLFNEMFTDHEITSDKYSLYTQKVPHYGGCPTVRNARPTTVPLFGNLSYTIAPLCPLYHYFEGLN